MGSSIAHIEHEDIASMSHKKHKQKHLFVRKDVFVCRKTLCEVYFRLAAFFFVAFFAVFFGAFFATFFVAFLAAFFFAGMIKFENLTH